MKTVWERTTLGELCHFRGGGTPSKAVDRFWRGDIPWVSPKDMKSTIVSDSIDHISPEASASSATTMIPAGAVLIVVRSGILARTVPIAISGRDLTINQDLKALSPNGRVSSRFLYYFLESKMDTVLGLVSRGATVHRLMTEQIRSIDLLLPPPLEQQRIVAILDEAFDGIAIVRTNAKKNLRNACAIFESHLRAVFTRCDSWGVARPLVEFCDPSRGITYGVIKLGDEVKNGVPCLRTSNVRWLRIDPSNMKRILPSLSLEYARTILRGGEVLVNVRGTLGGVAVVGPEMAGWNISREVALVPVNLSHAIPEFLCYSLGTDASQKWLGEVTKGAAYVGINLQDLRLLPIRVPNIGIQREIVRQLRKVWTECEGLTALYQRKLTALDELKKSLLHQAFTGQL